MLSIIVCTHNRSVDFIECIDGLTARDIPADYEVLVVDSASSPEEAKAVRDYLATKPFIRYHRLDTPGTCLARNTALALANGEWIWWLDDDAVPAANWPEALRDALALADDRTAIIGGKVIPQYPAGADTRHLTDRWKLLVTCIEDDDAGEVGEGRNVACANMLMRTELVRQVGGFSERIGRIGHTVLLSGEENLVIELLRDRGYKSLYTPDLSVRHKVSAQRLDINWVSRRAYGEGYSVYVINDILQRHMPYSLNPLKLWLSVRAFQLLQAFWPRHPDLIIRRNLAQGALDAWSRRRAP